MEETPIMVLEKKIKYYITFIRRLETREGIVPNTTETPEETNAKFNKIINDCRVKITEYRAAIESINGDNLEVFIKRKDGTELCRNYLALSILLKQGVLFNNERETVFQGEKEDSTTVLYVICNEVFCPTAADAESLKENEIGDLYKMFKAHGHTGVYKWCCIKRGEQPTEEVVKEFKEAGIWDEKMESLKPNEWESKNNG